MKRRNFLKTLAKSVAVLTVAPVAIAQATSRLPVYPYKIYIPDTYPNMGFIIPGDPIKYISIADDAYDGSNLNSMIIDEVGKTDYCLSYKDKYQKTLLNSWIGYKK